MRVRDLALVFGMVLVALGGVPTAQSEGTANGKQSVMAYPGLVTHVQPDGQVFEARQYGDEAYHWLETAEGYTVERNPQTGFYEYLSVDSTGRFKSTGLRVGRDNPAAAGLQKYTRESPVVIEGKRERLDNAIRQAITKQPGKFLLPTNGAVPLLVILVNFEDTNPITTPQQFDRLFNATTGSAVRAYYREVSYGAVTIQATIVGWVNIKGTHDSFNDSGAVMNSPNMVRLAIDEVYKTGFDFSPFDTNRDRFLEAVIFIHQGEGQEFSGNPMDIWSYFWFLTPPYPVDAASTTPGQLRLYVRDYTVQPELQGGRITTIGVICHEMGHAFGLPDLYDYTYFSEGVGNWDLMAGGSWNYVIRSGDSPAGMGPWDKQFLGWLTPTLANGQVVTTRRIKAPLRAVEKFKDVLKINMGPSATTSPEYLMLENRQWVGFDKGLPNFGLLVWHVDDWVFDNNNSPHYHVGLIQADGQYDLENGMNRGDPNDPFPGMMVVRSLLPNSPKEGLISNPNTNSWYWADTNIWIENISDPLPTMNVDLRFIPNLSFSSGTMMRVEPADPLRPPITFSNGSQRTRLSPGDPVQYALNILNRDINFPGAFLCEDVAPVAVEFWASRTGGLTLDFSAAPSTRTTTVRGNSHQLIAGETPLGSFPDGSFTFSVTLDRPNIIREVFKTDNMWTAKNRMLLVRPAGSADLTVRNFSFGPNWLRKGDSIVLGGQVVNQGTQATGPFWIEFWGSVDAPNKAYPTLDFMICDSIPVSNLAPGGSVNLAGYQRKLYQVPSHAVMQNFTVVCYADRNDQVNESNETNNYQSVSPIKFSTLSGMGPAAVVEPDPPAPPAAPVAVPRWSPPSANWRPAQADLPELTVDFSTVSLSGQQPPLYLQINLTVHNWGLSTATQSVANVYLSKDLALSPDDYVWLMDVPVPRLPPGQQYSTAVPVGLPPLARGEYFLFAECDARHQVAEAIESNNVFYAGPVFVGSDLMFEFFTFNELQPIPVPGLGINFSEPGARIQIALRLWNRGLVPANTPFWLELWGSRAGGLVLSEFLANSRIVNGLNALTAYDLLDVITLNSMPDGPYTVVVVADRTNNVTEVMKNNNRSAVAGKRLLELRPIRPINLRVVQFRFAPNPVGRGDWIKFSGTILNDGSEYTGPFWIEFWASRSKTVPTLDFPICDSIFVETLRPGQQVFLTPYQRTLYRNVPPGEYSIVCVVDRPDNIAETDESDNFMVTNKVAIY